MNGKYWSLVASVTFAALLLGLSSALAQVAPPLGEVQSFAILGGSGVTAAGGAGTVITGDVGSSSTPSVTGFPPALVAPGFFLHLANDAVVQQAQIDATGAYVSLNQACTGTIAGDTLGGLNLVPGVYCMGAGDLTGTLTLNGGPTDVWVFKTASTLTTADASNVALSGGANSCNVFWQVGTSATLGKSSTFRGSIFAGASVTMGTTANLVGRAVAQAAVTMDGSNTVGGCSGTAGVPPPVAPTLSKDFSPATIDQNGVSTLTITLSNPNTSVATLTAALTDTLPIGVVIAPTPNASTTCIGGAFTPPPSSGDTAVTLSAGAIPAGSGSTPGTCIVKVDVTSATAGSHLNTLATNALQTTKGNNANPAVATLTVNPLVGPGVVAPTVGKSFSPVTINVGDTSTLTIILSNSSTTDPIINAAFTDTLPTGLVIAAPNGFTSDCGGTPTAIAGTGTIALSGGTIPVGSGTTAGTCTVTVNVTAAAGGSYLNTLTIDNSFTTATLTVNAVGPTLSKLFSPSFLIDTHRDPILAITLCNPNSSPADLIGPLTDSLPDGVVIAATPNASTTCPGSGPVAATAGGTTVILPATRSIPAFGCCMVRVNVIATRPGDFVNTLLVNALQTSNGINTVSADATLTVKLLPVPMLSGWALIMLTALLALVAFAGMRRQAM
jgi:uncharacterized repeat protein (TIGR01451 family)